MSFYAINYIVILTSVCKYVAFLHNICIGNSIQASENKSPNVLIYVYRLYTSCLCHTKIKEIAIKKLLFTS